MIWRDEYKIGNELIDAQHEELFTRVGALMHIVVSDDAESRKHECIEAIMFLKDYAVKHFAEEEEFQESVNYRYMDFHKAIHSTFVNTVLQTEKKLIDTDFSLPVIKEFCGFLSMWLIYHVNGADQKILTDEVISVAEFAIAVSYKDCVLESMKEVLDTILGVSHDFSECDKRDKIENAIHIEIEYDETRNMRMSLSKDTALRLVYVITHMDLSEVDELAYAALYQFARTICGNAAPPTSKQAQTAGEIKAQDGSIIDDSEFFIRTKFGRLSMSLVHK